jgi:hypothetical protein
MTNREPANHLNCSANRRTCPAPVAVREPVPLCRNHAIEVALAIVPAVLGTALANHEPALAEPKPVRPSRPRGTVDAEVDRLVELIRTEGWPAVGLNRAIKVLAAPKATAAKRLAAARKSYANEIYQQTR